MTYAIIKCVNGNYFVHSEGIATMESAKTQYHQLCAVLWNTPDVQTASVIIADENLDIENECREFISHESERGCA